jgi:dihydropteroate synthase
MKSKLFPDIAKRTHVMGIINLTPDSFSGDGLLGKANWVDEAIAQAHRFVEYGVDILDLGGESTRPGYTQISVDEEITRLLPVIQRLRQELPEMILSVDCYRAGTAAAVLEAGVHIINDIWGFKYDEDMAQVVAKHQATAILMHNRHLGSAQISPELGGHIEEVHYEHLLEDIKGDLEESIALAKEAGMADEQIILDPGIGFAKTISQNLYALRHMDILMDMGYPILLGISRKGMIGYTLNLPRGERLEGSLAANAYGILHGANIVRVHDVKETVRLARMLDAIRFAEIIE